MAYLLDTNILSELRKPHCDSKLLDWVNQIDSNECFISVLSLGEIRRGVQKIKKTDPSRAKVFEKWLHSLVSFYNDRILPITIETALRWGSFDYTKNHPPIDALLGATALQHDLILVTRNISDFKSMEIEVINPFQ